MIPGPDRVIECPKCKALARVFTLMSGNTLGARRWTDGKVIAPMLPSSPIITKCAACGHYFWPSEVQVIGELPRWGGEDDDIPAAWKAAEHVRDLSEDELLEALAAGAARKKMQELHLRISAWWAGNDPWRLPGENADGAHPSASARTPEATANLERLLELLDMDDHSQRLMKAEVMRELGRYDEARPLLQSDFPKEYANVVALIRKLAGKKDSTVREIMD